MVSLTHTNGTTATTHFGWDGDRIVREKSDSQSTTTIYEPSRFVPILRIDDTQQVQMMSAFITDALGTPMQLVAANGETKWQAQPDDWAAVKNMSGSTSQPIRFQDQWHDEESGLYYNRHRYYDPQQGRYISQDPIGLSGGTNLYGYVTNPAGAVDPLGLEGLKLCAQEGSAAGGAAALASRAVAIGGRAAIPTWASNPWGAIVLAMMPTTSPHLQ
ncbi:RHS repeat-associated protein [Vreelandella songnenensis]|uniref:RHS repeat-associated protein n=1 Tax=Vreelandella songnenensis TaxID=1176243 RepID=A0A2T0UI58_9GAMM|nr:RHS repeat-associated core domain-containing protein [Halomonas songnenensis]PRY57574.1 RHS repeat-associated protein [Halomonas songnenensis]